MSQFNASKKFVCVKTKLIEQEILNLATHAKACRDLATKWAKRNHAEKVAFFSGQAASHESGAESLREILKSKGWI